jgi:hypothetical protein
MRWKGPTPRFPAVRSVGGIGNHELEENETDSDQSGADPVDSLIGDHHRIGWNEEEGCNRNGGSESSEGPEARFPGIPVGELRQSISIRRQLTESRQSVHLRAPDQDLLQQVHQR